MNPEFQTTRGRVPVEFIATDKPGQEQSCCAKTEARAMIRAVEDVSAESTKGLGHLGCSAASPGGSR